MVRVVIENILLFLLPTLLYVAFIMIRRRGQPNNTPAQALDDAPIFWLLAIGIAMMIGGLAYFGTTEGGKPGQTYVPPVYKDGKIQPGRIE